MLFPIKNREELENLEELISLQIKVEDLRLQDKLGKQNYHDKAKNYFNQ